MRLWKNSNTFDKSIAQRVSTIHAVGKALWRCDITQGEYIERRKEINWKPSLYPLKFSWKHGGIPY